MIMPALRTSFTGTANRELAAGLNLPVGQVRAYALFAHCFACADDGVAATEIPVRLASLGIAVLRFDFTGLGSGAGDLHNIDFSSNVEDLVRAADHMRERYDAPALLIGHSLGGAAMLAAAHRVPEAKAVITIATPSDVASVLHHFQGKPETAGPDGNADVTLAGRTFKIHPQLLDDTRAETLKEHVANLHKALLVMHAPKDQMVGIEHATAIFVAAKHPKSFVSLDTADHLLSKKEDAVYAADVIAAWVSHYIPRETTRGVLTDRDEGVAVTETLAGKFQNTIETGCHRLIADEPIAAGGLDSGPNPYDYLAVALGACTSMTLRLYAEHKKLALGRITVIVRHGKVPVEHCEDCGEAIEGRTGKIDRFERVISVEGGMDEALAAKVVEIAEKCPVHRTLEAGAAVVTRTSNDPLERSS